MAAAIWWLLGLFALVTVLIWVWILLEERYR